MTVFLGVCVVVCIMSVLTNDRVLRNPGVFLMGILLTAFIAALMMMSYWGYRPAW